MKRGAGVYTREDIAEITGLHYAVVKNWSIGKQKELEIKPSVRPAGVRGRLALFSDEDLKKFEVAKQLKSLGFTLKSIGQRMNELPVESVQLFADRVAKLEASIKMPMVGRTA